MGSLCSEQMAEFCRLCDPDSLLSTLSSSQLKSTSPARSRDQPTSNPFPRLEPSTPSTDDRGTDGYIPEVMDVEKAASYREEDEQAAENGPKATHSFVKGEGIRDRSESFTESSDDLPIELISLSDRYLYFCFLDVCYLMGLGSPRLWRHDMLGYLQILSP